MQSESRDQLEKALQDAHRTQSLLDATIKSTASGVVVCDLDVNFVLVNPAARKLLGKVADLGVDNWNETVGLFKNEEGQLFERRELPLFRACQGESIDRMQILVRNGVDDAPIWMEANATQILGLNNEPLGAVTVFNDVTQEVKSRLGLRELQLQTESKLAASNRQLDEVLNTIPEAIWRGIQTDDGFNFIYFSPGIRGITGFEASQLTDRIEVFDTVVHPEDRDRIKLLLSEMSLVGAKDTEVEYRLIHADGSIRWVVNRIGTVANDQSLLLQGIISDITSQRDARQAMVRVERLASIGTLAAGVAHEINNPLGAMMLLSELAKIRLADGNLSDTQMKETLDDIGGQIERCAEIVKGVQKFAGGESTDRTVCSLHQIAQESKSLIEYQTATRKIEIRIHETDGAVPLASVNESEIEQVFVNLLTNAMDASPNESTIEVDVRTVDDRVVCSVIDNGSGMSAEDEQAVFDPFYTSKRKVGGTGLGLSLSHTIIANHDGNIWIEKTELGHGTTVSFFLPIAK